MSHNALIGRLPEAERRRMLDTIAATARGAVVAVEHSYWRKLDDATTLIGRIVGTGFHPGGGCTDVLIIAPVDPTRRLQAIPASHVLRIRWASIDSYAVASPAGRWRLGEVLAGPPLRDPSAELIVTGTAAR